MVTFWLVVGLPFPIRIRICHFLRIALTIDAGRSIFLQIVCLRSPVLIWYDTIAVEFIFWMWRFHILMCTCVQSITGLHALKLLDLVLTRLLLTNRHFSGAKKQTLTYKKWVLLLTIRNAAWLQGVLCSRGGVGGIDLQLDSPIRGRTVTINDSILDAPIKAAEALAMLKGLVILRMNWVVWNAPFPAGPLSTLTLSEIILRNSSFKNLGGFPGLGKFSALETFVISSGLINTGFPSSICKLTNLKVLEVSSNLIRSVGPSCLGTLKTFQELRFPNNAISGSPPVWPANLPSLKVLDLSNNKLSGSIPEAYGKLSKVQLLLAGNNLSGRVPAALKGLPVSSFRPGNAGLCGAPLPNVCK